MSKPLKKSTDCFINFDRPVDDFNMPEKFTFPFYYDPHPLALLAVEQLQNHLQNQKDWSHNFGLDDQQTGLVIGKMFGVLVVQATDGTLGFLTAFSGKLAQKNSHPYFVPPVFDMLTDNSFFLEEEKELNTLNARLESLLKDELYLDSIQKLQDAKAEMEAIVKAKKADIKKAKAERKQIRQEAKETLSISDYEKLAEKLAQESQLSNIRLKHMVAEAQNKVDAVLSKHLVFEKEIDYIRVTRKLKSNALQNKLFQQYSFLNKYKEKKDLVEIFKDTFFKIPPAGAGECAAPKLLQYAFINDLKPIALAEFWWGASPKSEVRKHGQYYPACKGKCAPILGHMLEGTVLDDNPLLVNPAKGKELEILLDDDALVIVNKPAEFLSVPGIVIKDSVYTRIKEKYPEAEGSLIVHRLDMSTSGILILAKTKSAHKFMQRQFINRTIKKKYIAILDGEIKNESGVINLPLRGHIEDRPRQLVCEEHGKEAITGYKVTKVENGKTHITFFPHTGRTHQLRVHAAHQFGLNAPIIGDDLYGTKDKRLFLHAAGITFVHPITRLKMRINADVDFNL